MPCNCLSSQTTVDKGPGLPVLRDQGATLVFPEEMQDFLVVLYDTIGYVLSPFYFCEKKADASQGQR